MPNKAELNKTDKKAPSKKHFQFFRNMIVTGILVAVPIVLSLWVAWYLYSRLTGWGLTLADTLGLMSGLPPFWRTQIIRVLALIAILAFLFFLGLLMKVTIGRKVIAKAQALLLKVPLVNFIYSTCKQIGDTIMSSKSGNMFRQVVLIEYPRKGCYAIGFMTNENTSENSEVARRLEKGDLISVFMPTTPNPTSGFLMFIPRDECIMLDMSVSDAMRLIVSCGAILPGSEEQDGDVE
ncbi:MAG: DUF502 domain-containing protein [Lentisphaeria bacterium]|nr:DUF502 domain-containing protein [Lentisphaeria bacterium]